jgi:predicted Rossmann fold flavoprotein
MKYDIIIIGGGASGLMAASRACDLGAKVLLIEKNKQAGIKLLTTGGGRCNITNYIEDYKVLAANYKNNSRFLLSAFSKFGAKETVEFFKNLGIKTKIEANNRVFPVSDKARDVLNALIKDINKHKGEIKTEAIVKKIVMSYDAKNKIAKIILESGEELSANNYILTTGGRALPASGSTGDAYKWLKNLGHTVIKPRPGLTPIIVKEKFVKDLEGLSLTNVNLNLLAGDKKIINVTGDIIFTAVGLSGPAGLNLSRYIDTSIPNSKISLDIFPNIGANELEKKLQNLFDKQGLKTLKNGLLNFLPPKLIPVILQLTNLDGDKKNSLINKTERQAIINLLKHFDLSIVTIGDYDKAMITVGGLDTRGIDPKTMRSRLISNLFIAGELLDLDGPTGGFNLQLCWSTGYIAGENAIK